MEGHTSACVFLDSSTSAPTRQSDPTASLAEYAREVGKGIVIVTRNGKPVAALVSLENVDPETLSLSTNLDFIDLIKRSREEQKSKGGLSSEELRRRRS